MKRLDAFSKLKPLRVNKTGWLPLIKLFKAVSKTIEAEVVLKRRLVQSVFDFLRITLKKR